MIPASYIELLLFYSEGVGKKYYEMAMAPQFHAKMGSILENTMVEREKNYLLGGISNPNSESEPEDAPVVRRSSRNKNGSSGKII